MSADHDNGNTPRDGRGEVEVILPEWTTDGHLEEGTVHTWLDGAFDDAQAAVVAAHVEACAQCRASVAEARGFIAGASRLVRALDAVPSDVVPQADVERTAARIVAQARMHTTRDTPPSAVRAAPRRWYSATITRAAAAVLLMVGASAVWQRRSGDQFSAVSVADSAIAPPSPTVAMPEASQPAAPAVASAPSAPVASAPAAGTAASAASSRATPPARQDRPMMVAGGRAADMSRSEERAAMGVGASAPVAVPVAAPVAAPDAKKASAPLTVASKAAPDSARSNFAVSAAPAPATRGAAGGFGGVAGGVARGVAGGIARGVEGPAAERDAARKSSASGPIVVGRLTGAQGRPLEGALVSVVGNDAVRTSTDTAGRFVLTLRADSSTLLVRRLGYESKRLEVASAGRDTVRADVALKEANQMLAAVTVSTAMTPVDVVPGGACWVVSAPTAPPGMRLPNVASTDDAKPEKPISMRWYGWPDSGRRTNVTLTRDRDGMWHARAESRGAALAMDVTFAAGSWTGTATQRISGVDQAAEIVLTMTAKSMCK
jgi:hypothetical protein